eukprot:403373504
MILVLISANNLCNCGDIYFSSYATGQTNQFMTIDISSKSLLTAPLKIILDLSLFSQYNTLQKNSEISFYPAGIELLSISNLVCDLSSIKSYSGLDYSKLSLFQFEIQPQSQIQQDIGLIVNYTLVEIPDKNGYISQNPNDMFSSSLFCVITDKYGSHTEFASYIPVSKSLGISIRVDSDVGSIIKCQCIGYYQNLINQNKFDSTQQFGEIEFTLARSNSYGFKNSFLKRQDLVVQQIQDQDQCPLQKLQQSLVIPSITKLLTKTRQADEQINTQQQFSKSDIIKIVVIGLAALTGLQVISVIFLLTICKKNVQRDDNLQVGQNNNGLQNSQVNAQERHIVQNNIIDQEDDEENKEEQKQADNSNDNIIRASQVQVELIQEENIEARNNSLNESQDNLIVNSADIELGNRRINAKDSIQNEPQHTKGPQQ